MFQLFPPLPNAVHKGQGNQFTNASMYCMYIYIYIYMYIIYIPHIPSQTHGRFAPAPHHRQSSTVPWLFAQTVHCKCMEASINGEPPNGWLLENPIQVNLGVPLFQETPIYTCQSAKLQVVRAFRFACNICKGQNLTHVRGCIKDWFGSFIA